jgi:CBS domain-containing protein
MTTTLKLSDVITKNPHCLKENDSVFDAAKIMKERNVGVIPIVDNNQKPCGVVTDRDIVLRCIGENHDYKQCKVNEVFSKGVQKIYEDQTLDEALDIMKKNQLRRLVCVDRNDKLCGLLSLSDLACHVRDNNLLGDLLRQIHLPKGQGTQRP